MRHSNARISIAVPELLVGQARHINLGSLRLPRPFPKMLVRSSAVPHDARPTVLAISSPGGHWLQLRRMRKAWEDCSVVYASSLDGYAAEVARDAADGHTPAASYYSITDANRWQRIRLGKQLLDVGVILLRHRPDIVVTTGAAVGYFALRLGKLIGARTIWIDSIANANKLSLAGELARPYADLWLTQWEHLASDGGPRFAGAVL